MIPIVFSKILDKEGHKLAGVSTASPEAEAALHKSEIRRRTAGNVKKLGVPGGDAVAKRIQRGMGVAPT